MQMRESIVLFIAFACVLGPWSPLLAARENGTWTRKASMPIAFEGLSLGVIGGKIYALGGGERSAGGEEMPSSAQMLMYDPITNAWQRRASLPRSLSHVGVTVLDGKLYAIGGFTGAVHLGPQALAFVYDPKTNRWSTLASLPGVRGAVAAAAVDGKIHIFGGRNSATLVKITPPGAPEMFEGLGVLTSHDIYDPATNKWFSGKPLPGPGRDHLGIAVLEGRIHIFGGRTGGFNELTDRHDVYDPKSDRWSSAAPLPHPRSDGAFTVLDDLIIYAGGECKPGGKAFTPNTFDEVTAYDPKTDRWKELTPLPQARHGIGAASVGHIAYFAGGASVCGGGTTTELLALTLSQRP